ncbi:YitT family protein [Planomicrobium chinense]|uniref:YczE/YyaS/YitT family protein n=1 Tax=Planococcus chinensis TaxID=272917 RepID=UPI001CC4109A|nr:YitT family protein [Planococcus chinensis]MBZ5203055.1 YitT family protein [Planococcus chinensis]
MKKPYANFAFFLLGIMGLALGISLTILSDLGTSPFDAVLVGLSIKVGLTVGSWEVLLAVLMIGCHSLLTRHRPELLGLVTAVITGVGIDLWLFLLGSVVTPEIWSAKAICFIFGLVLIGAGTATYLLTNFAPIPIDRLTLIIKDLTRTDLFVSRTLIYLGFLIVAFLVGGPIGIGTVLTVCFRGWILNFFMKPIGKALNATLHTES